jgi:hypothetical protein
MNVESAIESAHIPSRILVLVMMLAITLPMIGQKQILIYEHELAEVAEKIRSEQMHCPLPVVSVAAPITVFSGAVHNKPFLSESLSSVFRW